MAEVDDYVFTRRMMDEGWTVVRDGAPIPKEEWNRGAFFGGQTLGIPYHDMEAVPSVEEMLRRTQSAMAGRRELDRHVLWHIVRDWDRLPPWFTVTLTQTFSVLVTGTVVQSPDGVQHVALFGPDVWFRAWLLPLNCPPDSAHGHVFALTLKRGHNHALGVKAGF